MNPDVRCTMEDARIAVETGVDGLYVLAYFFLPLRSREELSFINEYQGRRHRHLACAS